MCEKQYTIKDIIHRFDKLEQRFDKLEQQIKQRTVVKKAYTISEFAKAYNMTELKTRELIQRGKIKATSDTNGRGTRYLIDAKSIEDWWSKQLGKPIK
ncbi:helix-turn-helix domain-containing protein [Gardnerella sp. DNF01198P]|uniref:helix-turn-helix domain-containing protein n=1 Tax=unclassified Gardnerella TaxID=2628112 RepID=UPI003BAA11D8